MPYLCRVGLFLPSLVLAGCVSCFELTPLPQVPHPDLPSQILIPNDLDVQPTETVVQSEQRPSSTQARPRIIEPANPHFSLADVIAFARLHNPRLLSARAAVERAGGQEEVAFAPFLPQIDLLSQTGITAANQGPGAPGPTGYILPAGDGPHRYGQVEAQLQWILYDFGRTGSRYRQAAARVEIARLQLVRAEQTVEFDATVAYLNVLLARASRRVAEDAIRRAESVLHDARVRRKAGTADLDVVLRAEVQLSEIREALVDARQAELEAVSRLNNAMGRNAALPLKVLDLESSQSLFPSLASCLEKAANQRAEIGWAQQAVAAATAGRDAAEAEFRPRIHVRASVGNVQGKNVQAGWQEGAGLHLNVPLFAGGQRRGELRSACAEVMTAVANAQSIVDSISLEVNLAYRNAVAARERIDLTRVAVEQAQENLRLVRVKYRNGNATPTDIVDAETTLTRTQQRHDQAGYTYLAALARLSYMMGQSQGVLLGKADPGSAKPADPDKLPMPRVLPRIKES